MKRNGKVEQIDGRRLLPTGWDWVSLGEICSEIYRYPSFYGIEHLRAGVPVVRGEHIDRLGEIRTDWTQYWHVSPEVSARFPRTILKEGDLAFTVRGTIGKIGIVRSSHVGAQISPNLIRISPSPRVDPTYLWHYLRSIKGGEYEVEDNAVTVATVKASDLIALRVPLPPLPEQKRIAAILTEQMAEVERARAATEAQLEAAKALPGAYLREVFEGEEAERWAVVPFGELFEGNGQYGTSEKAGDAPHGVPVLRMGNLNDGHVSWQNLKYISLPTQEEAKYLLHEGDILFNRTNSAELVGKTAVFNGSRRAIFASYIIRFRPIRSKLSPQFVTLYINSAFGRRFIKENMTRAIGQVNISASTMQNMPIPVPPLDQQERIAHILTNQLRGVEQTRYALEEQLQSINKLPAALLRQAFNGEL